MCPVSQSPVHRRQWIYKICERVGNSPSIGNVDQGIDVNAIKKFYLKDNEKDPKLIANLVKDGNFGMPYLPEKLYADIRRLSMFRDQLNEDRIRNLNRLHREMKIYFPEYKDAFGKIDGAFSLELLKEAPFPDELVALGTEGMKQIWHEAKLRVRGYVNAPSILEYARKSVGIKDGADASRQAVKWFVSRIIELDGQLSDIENHLNQRCMEIPHGIFNSIVDKGKDE